MAQVTNRVVEFKLYPNRVQIETLTEWTKTCCWIYNRALEHRIKAYKRRKESVSLYGQMRLLTKWRRDIVQIQEAPAQFARSSLRRVDRGMKAFFRRVKAGQKPGFPRFRSQSRFNSIEQLEAAVYLHANRIHVPKLGPIRCRGIGQDVSGKQKLLRIIRRPSGWYAQIVFERTLVQPTAPAPSDSVGIDMGLTSFATLSNGEKIENPRFARKSESILKHLQRRLSRKTKGSRNRCKAIQRLARHHELIADQRKDFAHRQSTALVKRFGFIAHESLNIKGLSRTRLSKSILDAAWGQFIRYLGYKAAYAGSQVIAVNHRGTSQECPSCGNIRKKSLSERTHDCPCGLVIDRDHAAARVILARAAGVAAASIPVEGSASVLGHSPKRKPALRNRKIASVSK